MQAARDMGLVIADPHPGLVDAIASTHAGYLRAGSERVELDLVLPTERGTPPDSSSVRKHFHAVCARAKVEPRRIHDWRATVASWLADLNVHDDTARQVLRHSESNTTIDYYTKTMGYYTKSSSETRRAAIQALDQLFNG